VVTVKKKILGWFLPLLFVVMLAGIATASGTNEKGKEVMVSSGLVACLEFMVVDADILGLSFEIPLAIVIGYKDHSNIYDHTLCGMSAGAMDYLPDIGYKKGSAIGSQVSGKQGSVAMAYLPDIGFYVLC
jgi:hypothetical protein